MREDINLKISQLIDGDLGAPESLKLLTLMDMEPEIGDRYRRYDALSQAIKSDVFIRSDSGFVDAVAARIAAEPVVLAPGRRLLKPGVKTFTALAASVAIVSVIAAGSLQMRERSMVTQLSMQPGSMPLLFSSALPRSNDTHFKEYLAAHGATLYAERQPAAQRYGRVAGYERR